MTRKLHPEQIQTIAFKKSLADDGFAGVWQGMTPNARYDAIIKAKLAALVRSGNDGHVWRLVDAKWENLTERQREALRFEIPEPSAKTPPADDFDTADQGTALPDGQGDGKGRVPAPASELIQDAQKAVLWYEEQGNKNRADILRSSIRLVAKSNDSTARLWIENALAKMEAAQAKASVAKADAFDKTASDVLDDIFGAKPVQKRTDQDPVKKRSDDDIAKDLGSLFNEDPAKFNPPWNIIGRPRGVIQ